MARGKGFKRRIDAVRGDGAKSQPSPKSVSGLARSQKSLKRSQIKPRRPSQKATVDGDSAKAVKDECDEIVRQIVRLRDFKCVTCWTYQDLHVGHLFRRGIESVRWNLLNVAGQCDPCNLLHEEDGVPYMDAFIDQHGEDVYRELVRLSRSKHKFTYVELLDVRDGLRAELAARKVKERKEP